MSEALVSVAAEDSKMSLAYLETSTPKTSDKASIAVLKSVACVPASTASLRALFN